MSYDEVDEWIDDQGRSVVRLLGSERRILDAIKPDVPGIRRWWRLRLLRASHRNIAEILLSGQHCFLCRGRCPRCEDPALRKSPALRGRLVPEIKDVDHVAADAIVCSADDCDYRIPLSHHL
jgi:hypothetical protein